MFDSYFTAIWCVVITMTTVGYGDVYAVSPFGRIISLINALWGAFIISMLVASIGKIFELSENQKRAVADISNHKQAARSLKASFNYLIGKKSFERKKQALEKGLLIDDDDNIHTKQEIEQLKRKME